MYHSITFGDGSLYPSGHEKEGQFKGINTWDDWHLIPSERPCIANPAVSTKFVEIPGRDGAIDMSTFLVNRPVYGMRQGTIEFYVDNDHEYWETIRSKIANYLHGKRLKMVLEDDPRWYWEGRFSFDEWRSEANNSRVTISYSIDPFKIRIESEGDHDIIWDSFNFETDDDYYASLNNIEVNNDTYTCKIIGREYAFEVYATGLSGSVTVQMNNGSVHQILQNDTQSIGRVVNGENIVNVAGSGSVRIHFTGGSL